MDYRKSADSIQKELLSEIEDSYEKSKGYFLWDILKAVAVGMKNLLEKLQIVSDKLDIENIYGEERERFIFQRTGITRRQATFSEGVITVKGNGIVKKGDLFETEGLIRFKAVETVNVIEQADIIVKAVTAGAIGNVPMGSITKMPITIQGITSCTNHTATEGGYQQENDKDLLVRYYERLREPATSGNIYHYKRWAKEVEGVGAVNVFPLWNGDNTVKIVIIDLERQPASDELVEKVQNYIDPNSTGTGQGQAPIGAYCTVESAKPKIINVSVLLHVSKYVVLEVIKKEIENKIIEYFKQIAFEQEYASFAQIGANILSVENVLDYENMTLNGLTQNITCQKYEVMILGEVTLLNDSTI
ncbi:MAG: baseplate J/gp47 family protein [Firmicutes bacterium]|jgi:uncharacterized phage protein gp47/JayE|nr:baseplate J/gp47 family protein [Bacillota bacterium]